jgi:hypothetical protein
LAEQADTSKRMLFMATVFQPPCPLTPNVRVKLRA